MKYGERVLEELKKNHASEPEFIQAATEVLETIQPALDAHPEFEAAGLLERLVEPERVVMFRVPWVDDNGKVQVNRGYRVQFNSAIGTLQGRFETSSDSKPRRYKVPRLRADFQEFTHNSSDRRR